MKTPLWIASDEHMAQANITRFMNSVNTRPKLNLASYSDLYKWSVEDIADFWSEIWDFAENKASKRFDSVVTDLSVFPGAKWFPGAKLNFAENLLRCRDQEAAEYAVRAIHNERVFLQLERAKAEQGKLYRAAEQLNAAKSEQDVIEAGVRSAREVTSVDYAALTLFDEGTKTHEIRAINGDFEEGDGTAAMGARFRANTGLVSMALENRHPLPYRGQFDEKKQIVFTRHTTPPKMPSLFVLPLAAHDRPLGTLVLGSRRRGAFGESVRGTLEVMGSHMAVSLEGARMMKRLEELATTDGLTGLLNKRAMLDVAEAKIAAARRFGRQLAVLVTDIDHFKKVNDTNAKYTRNSSSMKKV